MAKAKLLDRYKWVDAQLEGKNYLMGDAFSVADAYLFTVTNWAKHVGIDISGLKNLGAFMSAMAARPAVQEAMKAEGPAEVSVPVRRSAALIALVAASSAGATPAAPGRYDAELCVATRPQAAPTCGAAEVEVTPARISVRVADIVYRLALGTARSSTSRRCTGGCRSTSSAPPTTGRERRCASATPPRTSATKCGSARVEAAGARPALSSPTALRR